MHLHSKTPLSHSEPGTDEHAIIRRLSAVSIVGNTLLSAFKLFAGIAGHSGAMLSDAIHSLSDVLTTIIAFVGTRLSSKEADQEHPYGHERFECMASLILGIILAITSVEIGKPGVQNILSGHYQTLAVPSAIALAAAALSILSKEAMYWYTLHYAKLLHSTAFLADAWHHRSDALTSIGSLVGLAGAMLGFPILDSVASVVICLFILKVAYDIIKDAAAKLLDTSCGAEYERKLSDYIASQDDVVGIDLLHSRMFGSKTYIDVAIRVDGSLPLWEAHAIGERIHCGVEQEFPEVKHIVVHLNPTE